MNRPAASSLADPRIQMNKTMNHLYADCPLQITITFKPGMVQHWSERFEYQLRDAWERMIALRDDTAEVEQSEGWTRFELRRMRYDRCRETIKSLWKPLTSRYNMNAARDEGFWNSRMYLNACWEFYENLYKEAMEHMAFDRMVEIRQHIQNDEHESNALKELFEDDFLKELWEECGMHALKKIRFPAKSSTPE